MCSPPPRGSYEVVQDMRRTPQVGRHFMAFATLGVTYRGLQGFGLTMRHGRYSPSPSTRGLDSGGCDHDSQVGAPRAPRVAGDGQAVCVSSYEDPVNSVFWNRTGGGGAVAATLPKKPWGSHAHAPMHTHAHMHTQHIDTRPLDRPWFALCACFLHSSFATSDRPCHASPAQKDTGGVWHRRSIPEAE